MRWLLIGLGVLTIFLAAILAGENQWWIAVPDGLFGLGVAGWAWLDLHAFPSSRASASAFELRPAPATPASPAEAPPAPRSAPPPLEPAPAPAPVLRAPAPAKTAPPAAPQPTPAPKRSSRKRRRH